jgi:predicted DNA-binding transcriptional regulator AlpA
VKSADGRPLFKLGKQIMEKMRLMNIVEFCAESRMSRATFYSLEAQGKLPPVLKVGGRRYVSRQRFEEWLENLEAEALISAKLAA